MTFQDEFARRLNAVRGVGDGGEDAPDKSVRLERSRETLYAISMCLDFARHERGLI